ncbi:ABC transporter substrate-binding protein [Psychromonas ossibalaenae]|uniref:ABC transporter substrate-binding protein n=1 Tax=Psychromonas ossibalaenae TaxID=444922 RepID=UPI0003778C27|nr:ABC transporter substrate-binding protein [Psychromonas ossibalaenae]
MKHFLVKLFLFINLFISIAVNAQPLHFVLLSGYYQDDFWEPVEDFAQQAAKQLDIKLSILYTNDSKREMLKLLSKVKELNADAVIFPNFSRVALQLMKEAEQQQIPLLLFNSDLTEPNKQLAGKPQQKFKYWLASLLPDDHQAGYLLGKHLIEQARQKNFADKNGTVQIIAIKGTIADTPTRLRFAGLERAIKEDGNSKLLQSVYAFWDQQQAYYKSQRLSLRYPQAKVYWAASDLMAIGVNNELTENGLRQGKDYLTGGVDWSEKGLAAIKQGKISTSAGGHFMDGAWAVIMLYDHFNGSPLNADSFYQFQSPMTLITSSDIDLLLPHLESHDWKNINFRLRSKVFNKHLKEYDFSPASILEELRKAQD